jgi:hypothetical protein
MEETEDSLYIFLFIARRALKTIFLMQKKKDIGFNIFILDRIKNHEENTRCPCLLGRGAGLQAHPS